MAWNERSPLRNGVSYCNTRAECKVPAHSDCPVKYSSHLLGAYAEVLDHNHLAFAHQIYVICFYYYLLPLPVLIQVN